MKGQASFFSRRTRPRGVSGPRCPVGRDDSGVEPWRVGLREPYKTRSFLDRFSLALCGAIDDRAAKPPAQPSVKAHRVPLPAIRLWCGVHVRLAHRGQTSALPTAAARTTATPRMIQSSVWLESAADDGARPVLCACRK